MKSIHMLHVEDRYADELVTGFRNLTDTDGSFRLVVDSCRSVEDGLEKLRVQGLSYDIALVDAELFDKRGVTVLAAAKDANLSLTRVLYSGNREIDADDMARQVHEAFWTRARIFTELQKWCARRARACDLSTDGTCLWRLPERTNLPDPPYCYASLPHSEEAEFQVRAAVVTGLIRDQWGGMKTVMTGLDATDDARAHIFYGIRHCAVFLADLFQLRSNVLIEVGMAIAMNRPVVLLAPGTPEKNPPPYDVAYRKVIWYGDSLESPGLPADLRKWYRRWVGRGSLGDATGLLSPR
jgi:hypothetical protein